MGDAILLDQAIDCIDRMLKDEQASCMSEVEWREFQGDIG